jgi:hypothetical protein
MLDQKFINAGRMAVAFDLDLKELMQLVDAVGSQFAFPPRLGYMLSSISVPEGEPYSFEKSRNCAISFIHKNRFELFENIEFWEDIKGHFGLGDDDSIVDYKSFAETIIFHFSDSIKEEKIQLHASTLELVFLESSLVNKIDSIRYLYKCGYILKNEVKGLSLYIISTALDENKKDILAFEVAQQDSLLLKNAKSEEAIRAWETILPKLQGKNEKSARVAIEKWRGKTHEEAFKAARPGIRRRDARQYISKLKKTAKDIAQEYGLLMPPWKSR